jgi:hypothetical protein
MPDPWLTNPDRTHSTDYLPLRQMAITYYQPLAMLVPLILVKLDIIDHLVLDSCL